MGKKKPRWLAGAGGVVGYANRTRSQRCGLPLSTSSSLVAPAGTTKCRSPVSQPVSSSSTSSPDKRTSRTPLPTGEALWLARNVSLRTGLGKLYLYTPSSTVLGEAALQCPSASRQAGANARQVWQLPPGHSFICHVQQLPQLNPVSPGVVGCVVEKS